MSMNNPIRLDGDLLYVTLTQGAEVLIDAEDYPKIKDYRWHRNYNGYACRNIRNKDGTRTTKTMHRILMGDPKGFEIDHINCNRLDNRKCNLRITTRRENSMNLLKYKKRKYQSQFKGVGFDKRTNKNPWKAYIKVNKKMIHLGVYSSEIEAAKAYNEAALKYFGEFAKLNQVGGKVS